MAIEKKYISAYDRRVKLTTDAMTQHSKMDEKSATKLAIHVLHALDHIPENLR
jgi:uncharacterized protein DUF6307